MFSRTGLLFTILLLAVRMGISSAAAATTWRGPSVFPDQNAWNDPDNWNNGIPQAETDRTEIGTDEGQFNFPLIDGGGDPPEAFAGQLLVLGDSGALQVSGGTLSAGSVMAVGQGSISHSGGIVSVDDTLSLEGPSAEYSLSGEGTLSVGRLSISSGRMEQSGGSVTAANVTIDQGSVVQSGGLFSVGNTMSLTGPSLGFGAKYTLGANGTLSVPDLNIRNGIFTQNGGSFSGTMTLGLLGPQDDRAGGTLIFNGGTFNGTLVNNNNAVFGNTGASDPLVFSAPISGNGRNSILGNVSFSGQNTFSGINDLQGGTLSVSSDANLGQANSGLNFNNGILRITGQSFTNLGQHPVTWQAGGSFDIADAANAFTVSQDLGVLPEGCEDATCNDDLPDVALTGLTKLGPGTLVLTGRNTYQGGTSIVEGKLQGNSDSLQGDIRVAQDTRLIFDQVNTGSYGGTISGAGGLIKQGEGTLILSGSNAHTGGTTLAAGTLSVASDASLGGAASPLNFDGGVLQVTGTTFNATPRTVNWGAGGGGFDIADATHTFTVSQVLSGSGGLSKLGAGTLALTGQNTYSGATNLNEGTLSARSDANLGAASAPLNFNGGTLRVEGTSFTSTARPINWGAAGGAFDIVDAANTFTVSQVLSGSGGLTKLGDGTLVLTGANTFTGRTEVLGGILQGNSTILQGDVSTSQDTQLVFDEGSADGTYAGTVTGSGSLTKAGEGTLILSGSNTHTGGTILTGGTLSVASDDSLGDPASALNFDGGTLRITGTSFNSTLRTINWGEGGGGFDIANAAHTFTLSQSLNGSGGLTKLGGGTLILNGNNTYTGLTVVQEGNLEVGDAAHGRTAEQDGASILGPVRVDPTGILSGHGTIIGSVNNFGTIAPGGSIGTLTVNGDVAFNRGSTFQVEISPTRASRLNATGQASLGNAAVNVVANAGTYAPRSYTILQAAGGVAGKFGKLSIPNALSIPSLRLMTPSLNYFADRVDLKLESVSSPVSAPEHVTRQLITGLLRMVGGRLDAPLGENCPVNRLGFWARGIGMISTADGDGFSPGYDAGTAGSVMGFDLQVSERVSVGIAGFAGHTDVSLQQAARSNGSADSAMVSLYGAFTSGAWQFKSVLAYDNDTYTAQRSIAAGDARQAYSKTYGNRVNDYTELSYSFRSGDVAIQPIVGVQLGWMRQNPLTESGTNADGQNLSVDGRTLYTFDTLVGVRSRYERSLIEGLKAQFELRAVYDHDFGTLQDAVGARRSDNQPQLLSTADRPNQRDAGIVGASLALLTANTLNFYLDYNGEIRGGQQAHFISAGVRYAW